jgi:hypothetical protein
MTTTILSELAARVRAGTLVPYLGPGVLADVTECGTGAAMPADSDSLILAMNGGRPMSARLMYEFPRAAMDMELKKGRASVTRFLVATYGTRRWTRAPLHDWLAGCRPPYVIDINRDIQLQDSYSATPHTLIRGVARIGGTDFRYRIHHYDGSTYREIPTEEVDTGLPILFKPMGSPLPDPAFIASDADYVDYISELMGGFAIPSFVKQYRKDRQYLLLGMRLNRDTERMVLSDMLYGAAEAAGWALIPEPTDKERRFCARIGIEVIDADVSDLLQADGDLPASPASPAWHDASVGC